MSNPGEQNHELAKRIESLEADAYASYCELAATQHELAALQSSTATLEYNYGILESRLNGLGDALSGPVSAPTDPETVIALGGGTVGSFGESGSFYGASVRFTDPQ